MKCPFCGESFKVSGRSKIMKEVHIRFLEEWNKHNIVKHRKVTTRMEKAIDKVIKNADYPISEVFDAFENYAKILNDPDYFWTHKWTMEDFLNRGLHKFVDEAEPLSNNKIKEVKVKAGSYNQFDCGGSSI